MDDGWLCESCRSINRPGDNRCYSCRQNGSAAGDTPVAPAPAPAPSAGIPTSGTTAVPSDLQELARRTGSAIVVLPSVPDALAMLESFDDIDLPATMDLSGTTNLPGATTFHLTPDKWVVASGLPVERIDALVKVSTPIWQLITVASAAGAAGDVQELAALLERRTTVVRLGELGRAVDRIAATLSPVELGRLASEGEEHLGRFASEVPPDADPTRTALAHGVETMLDGLYASTVAQGPRSPVADEAGPPSPMATYVWCYRTIATMFEASARARHS